MKTAILAAFALILALACAVGCSQPKAKSDVPDTAAATPAPQPVVTDMAEYEGRCAMGVCTGNFDVKGNPEIKLEKDGKIYYFESLKAKKKFEKKLASNIKKANRRWHEFVDRGGAHAQ